MDTADRLVWEEILFPPRMPEGRHPGRLGVEARHGDAEGRGSFTRAGSFTTGSWSSPGRLQRPHASPRAPVRKATVPRVSTALEDKQLCSPKEIQYSFAHDSACPAPLRSDLPSTLQAAVPIQVHRGLGLRLPHGWAGFLSWRHPVGFNSMGGGWHGIWPRRAPPGASMVSGEGGRFQDTTSWPPAARLLSAHMRKWGRRR